MFYPIAIHHEEGSAFGITVPDVPGCFSASDTLEQAIRMAEEAIASHLQILFEDGEELPLATSIDNHWHDADFVNAHWAYANVDVSKYSGKTRKENVTMPMNVTEQIEKLVRAKMYKSRSAFITEAAMEKLKRK